MTDLITDIKQFRETLATQAEFYKNRHRNGSDYAVGLAYATAKTLLDAILDKVRSANDLEVGRVYLIEWRDPNYPCHCQCHSNSNIMHIAPCCYDGSYTGPATLAYKSLCGHFAFLHGRNRFIILRDLDNVRCLLPSDTPMEITQAHVDYIRTIIGDTDENTRQP